MHFQNPHQDNQPDSASDWKLKMETPFLFYYTTKSSILLENRLVIVTEDGTLSGDSQSRNAPTVADEEKS